MTAFRQARVPVSKASKQPLGLTAIGSSGAWKITIDETTSGADRWFAEIEGPALYVRFEIPSLDVIDRAIGYLTESRSKLRHNGSDDLHAGALILGTSKQTPVSLQRDTDGSDRFYLEVQSKGVALRVTLMGTDLASITAALRQAREDIDEDA